MLFRVASFKRQGRKLKFDSFIYYGVKMDQMGDLWFENRILNTKDRRKKVYFKKCLCTGRKDEKGRLVFEGDICEINGEAVGEIEYLKNKGAFLLIAKNGFMRIPYSFLDKNEAKLIVKGNIYENEHKGE